MGSALVPAMGSALVPAPVPAQDDPGRRARKRVHLGGNDDLVAVDVKLLEDAAHLNLRLSVGVHLRIV